MIRHVRLPIDWSGLGFSDPWDGGAVVVSTGERAWSWEEEAPRLAVAEAGPPPPAVPKAGWGIDHVVLLVPDLEDAVAAIGREVRGRTEVRGRSTAFFVVGTVLEVIEEESVDRPLLHGIALETSTPLREVADLWRDAGFDVADPHPAVQPGREIFSVNATRAGLAVMTPRT